MENLPKNWVHTDAGGLSEIIRGVSYKKNDAKANGEDGDYLVLRGGNIQDGKIVDKPNDAVYVDPALIKEEQKIRKGDVVIVGSTGSKKLIGKAGIAFHNLENISFGAFLMLVRPLGSIDHKYFDYFFLSDNYRNVIRELAGGVNINNIRKEYITGLKFPLSPLAEQQRIVAKLDSLFGHLESAKTRLEKVPQLLKNFRQAILTQAVTGKLTEEWRVGKELGDASELLIQLKETRARLIENKKVRNVKLKGSDMNDNLGELPMSWAKASLYDVANIIDPNPSHRMPVYYNEGIPFLSTENIEGNILNFNKGKKVGDVTLQDQKARFEIKEGDFIYTRIGTIGKSCYIPTERNYCLSHAVCVISSYDKYDLMSEYLRLVIGSKKIMDQGLHGVQSVGVPDLGMGKVRCFQVPLCSREEQATIVSKVEALFSKADGIEEKYKGLKQKIDNLPQAILAKAFKGELVEQLDTDGDARDLLKEIEALKSSVPPKKRNKK